MKKQSSTLLNLRRFSRPQKQILSALTITAFLLRLFRLDVQSLWFDESLSAIFAQQPLNVAIQLMLLEGLHHSPLYYILLRPFAIGEFHEFSIRFLSVCLGTLAIPLIAQMGRITLNPRVGILAAILLTINPFHIWYSQEARMYALLITTTLGAMYFFSKTLNRSRLSYWLAMIIFTSVGINSHHFAFYIPLIQFIFILVTFKQNFKIFRKWVVAQILVGLSFIPWILIVLNWGKFYFSSAAQQTPTAYDLLQTFWNFSIGFTEQLTPLVAISLATFFVFFILGSRFLLQTRRNNLLLIGWLVIPIAVTFLVSFRFSTYMDRYISLSLPAFILLVATGIEKFPPAKIKKFLVPAIIIFLVFWLSQIYYNPNVYYRADWRSTGSFLEQEASSEDIIATWYYQDLLPLRFYYHGQANFAPIVTFDRVELPVLPDKPGSQKVWVVIAHPNNSAHTVGHCQDFDIQKISSPPETKNWRTENEYRLNMVKTFPCIRVELYQ